MAQEQDRHDHLSAFEAALAALKPRTDELNRDRLMFLAGQASVWSNAEGAALGASSPSALHTTEQACSSSEPRRWGWSAAFGAMTAIAAGLLVALVMRPPRLVERIVEVPAAPSKATTVPEDRHDRDAPRDAMPAAPRRAAEPPSDWLALFLASFDKNPSAALSPTEASRYLRLRELACSRGLDAWPTPAAVAAAGFDGSHPPHPASQRELLDELLETPEGQRPKLFPESPSHLGEKS
jgi:hypothetical protein